MSGKRKLQISNGHYLDFDHLARITDALFNQSSHRLILMKELEQNTGLPFRQVRNRVSIARALGLINRNKLQLTTLGQLCVTHDPFFDTIACLEFLHFKASSRFENLVWYESFNSLLKEKIMLDYPGWLNYFKTLLLGKYTEHSLRDHLGKEVRFILDAYLGKNFNKLLLLHEDTSGNIYQRRYHTVTPLILCAMIYDFGNRNETSFFQISEFADLPGSPAVVFGLDLVSFRQQIEGLHDRGWLKYETTHNLDQIRLKPHLSAISFLSAHFEGREPSIDSIPNHGDIIK
jgi:hypothetical protein